MGPELVGILGIIILLAFFLLGMPVGIALLTVGFLGYSSLTSIGVGLSQLGMSPFGTVMNYSFSVIPLFVLMGMFLSHCGIGRDLYDAIGSLMGHLKGGMAIATIGACALFGAISGSIAAAAATMASVALPEMRRHGYNPSLATGCVAAGGTLGVLIPPSVALILYGILTMEPIGKLLIAGLLPGILQTVLFMLAIHLQLKVNPSLAPLGAKVSHDQKIKYVVKIWPILVLFLVSIGGIYVGVFTPTEAGGVGAFGAFLFALCTGRLTPKNLIGSLDETCRITAMIFLILIGATLFGKFLAVTKIPMQAVSFTTGLTVSPYIVLAGIMLIYLILGCFMEGIAVMVLTIPIIYPVIIELGFDGIWFGVILVLLLNVGALTPPLGINVFIVGGIAKDVPLSSIFRGVVPMLIAMIVCIIILSIFPQIVMFLPNLMS